MIKIIRWAITTELLSFPRGILRDIFYTFIAAVFYNDPHRVKVFALIRSIRRETEILLSDIEAYQLYMCVKRTQKIKGDIAEVGVYRGGSAKVICEARGKKTLYLFDTFEKHPDVREFDKLYRKKRFLSTQKEVENYLKKYSDVHIFRGVFTKTAQAVEDKIFSFVHLDVDTYESTMGCLGFFYSRVNTGGIMLLHDYINPSDPCTLGAQRAIDDFFCNKPEPLLEMFGSQCLIVKL